MVRAQQGKHLSETMQYNVNIVKYFGWMMGIELGELVCDYIKDEMGTWWLINVKAFRISKIMHRKCKISTVKVIQDQ